MKQWFNQLKRNEQLMLVLCLALVVAYIIFQLLLVQRAEAREQVRNNNQLSRTTLIAVAELAAQYKHSSANASNVSGPQKTLAQIVNETVPAHQLSMKRFQPSSNGDASVRFENAAFNQILAWLLDVETNHPVVVKDLSVSPGNGSGLVNVSVRLRPGV